jgi:hypothetical protein
MRRTKQPSQRTSKHEPAAVRTIENLDQQSRDTLLQCEIGGNHSSSDLEQWLLQIAAIQTHVAPLAIAQSVIDADDWVWPVAEFIGVMPLHDAIQALDARLEQQGVDSSVPTPHKYSPDDVSRLDTAVTELAVDFGRAGYMLGLAIGTLLGPNALKGGPR